MHILFLTDNFPPEANAPASRTFEHCREWVKAGHQVTVITCAPNFPKGKVFGGYRNEIWQSEEMAGIQVIRVWSYITRNDGFTKRVLDYVSFMITASIAALFVRRVDLIIGTSPQFFTACAAYIISVLKRRPWVFELRDIWPESIRAVSAMNHSRVLDFLEKVELFLYRKSTAIISVTHAFKKNLIDRGVDESKIHVITNGADTSRFFPRPKDAELEAELGLKGKFVAGYIGTHGLAHALDTLLDTAELLQENQDDKNVCIIMVGEGAKRQKLVERARSEGLSNVLFFDSVSKDQVARYWSLLDVAIIHLKKNNLFKTVIPSKLFECMGMGIPVLHGVEGESANIVTKNDVGITIEPENPKMMLTELLRLKQDYQLLKQLSLNGPKAATNYSRENLANDMLQILMQLHDQFQLQLKLSAK